MKKKKCSICDRTVNVLDLIEVLDNYYVCSSCYYGVIPNTESNNRKSMGGVYY